MSEKITIQLTASERKLLQKYGYPFENIEKQLKDSVAVKGSVEITDEAYWWEQVLGQLSISAKEQFNNDTLCEGICDLANEIEFNFSLEKNR